MESIRDKSGKWVIRKMPEVVKWGSGGTPPSTVKEYYEGGTIPWLVIGDLNDGVVRCSASKITELGLLNSSAKMMPAGTLLLALYGSIGKLGITDMACCTNQAIAYARELHGVTTKYMFYFLLMMRSRLISMGKGGTQKNISLTVLNTIEVPVPPLSEQERIVARIEELFSAIDKGVETLHTLQRQLAVYRQAVLKEAFSTLDGIDTVLKDVIMEKPRNGYSPKEVSYETPYKKLTLTSTTGGVFKDGYYKYVDLDISKDSYLWVRYEDILIQRSNTREYVGTAAIYRGKDCQYVYPDLMMKCHVKPEHNPEFILYQLQSATVKAYFRKHATGTAGNMPKINQSTVMSTPITLVPIEQQNITVSKIESRLSLCDKIEQIVDQSLRQAEALRQSILRQAFSGELQ
ncbi:MAG TPA: restriction endonuclease subunit S [Methanocorpusculum sp.]|nr:restriction endonuclease subunit S [Methanocorpusculum sp.]HJK67634.1 restriction endonuclease subunit S [Methanocorpusculum sp.]